MSKHRTESASIRTVETVEKEIADLTAERREIGQRLKALRAEKAALIEAARVAAEVDLAARFRAVADDPAALARLAAEVAETADDDASGAAPPAPEDDPDDGYHG